MMIILDHYIRRTVIFSTLMVNGVILGMQAFLTLIQQFHYIGEKNYDVWHAFIFACMQLPAQIYQLFPMAAFLGTLIGLGRLAASSQLIIMRTGGVSITRILWSVLKAAILMIIVMTALGEGVGPLLQQQAQIMQNNALHPTSNHTLLHSIWLHHGDRFTYIDYLLDATHLVGVTQFQFATDDSLKQTSFAKTGSLAEGKWILSQVTGTIFHQNHTQSYTQRQVPLSIAFRPMLQIQMKIVSAEQTLGNLYQTILYRQSTGLSVNQFIFSWWQRVLQPMTSLVMIGLAVPFVFGSFRSTSMSTRIMIGVLLGFIFYILNQLFGPITLVYQFPPLLAAILPTSFFLGVLVVCLAVVR